MEQSQEMATIDTVYKFIKSNPIYSSKNLEYLYDLLAEIHIPYDDHTFQDLIEPYIFKSKSVITTLWPWVLYNVKMFTQILKEFYKIRSGDEEQKIAFLQGHPVKEKYSLKGNTINEIMDSIKDTYFRVIDGFVSTSHYVRVKVFTHKTKLKYLIARLKIVFREIESLPYLTKNDESLELEGPVGAGAGTGASLQMNTPLSANIKTITNTAQYDNLIKLGVTHEQAINMLKNIKGTPSTGGRRKAPKRKTTKRKTLKRKTTHRRRA